MIDAQAVDIIFEALACDTLSLKKGGNATELACIKLLTRCKYDFEETRKKYVNGDNYKRLFFDPERKKMSTIIMKGQGMQRLYIKGAAERIVGACKFYQSNDSPQPLKEELKIAVENEVDSFNREALRTIAVAYRNLTPEEGGKDHDEKNAEGNYIVEEDNLTLLCLLGIRDTLRPGVEEAVTICSEAGIKIRMVTGDNVTTARTIASNCGILNKDHEYAVMDGETFSRLLGGLYKSCNSCQQKIKEEDLEKHKEKRRLEVKLKREEEEKVKLLTKGGKPQEPNEDNDDEDEPGLEKQDAQDECPYCEKKEVVEKVTNMDKFKEIVPYLCVLARSRPLDKLLLVTALKDL